MVSRGPDPQAAQKRGDDRVLLRFGPGGQVRAGAAAFEEQRARRAEILRRVQADGAVAGPGGLAAGLERVTEGQRPLFPGLANGRGQHGGQPLLAALVRAAGSRFLGSTVPVSE